MSLVTTTGQTRFQLKSLSKVNLFERPLRPNAVVSLVATPSSPLNPTLELDWYAFGAIVQAFLYNHEHLNHVNHGDTNAEFEYVVMLTPLVPPAIRTTLLSLGARILVVPSLQIAGVTPPTKNHQYEFVHTKLQLWKLEGVYRSILSIDADLFHVTHNPVPSLFKVLDDWRLTKKAENSSAVFFGGCKDCCNKELNELVTRKSSTPPYSSHMEQSLLTEYHKEVTNNSIHWFPYEHNNMISVTNATNETIGYHYKFWDKRYGNAGQGVYTLFQKQLRALRGAGIVVPVFPALMEDFAKIRDSGAMYDRVAILSVDTTDAGIGAVEERTRIEYSDLGYQADHYYQSRLVGRNGNTKGLLGSLKAVTSNALLGGGVYEWVWVLSSGVYLTEEWWIHVVVGELKKERDGKAQLIMFRDCGKERTGTFFVRRAALQMIQQYVGDVEARNLAARKNGRPHLSDGEVVEGFIKIFDYFGLVSVRDTNDLYWYQYSSCPNFHPLISK
ncbi:hypothetical protein BCR33DRAFT_717241 [Rhizoclosmatium globosum]|uniref:Nucleotide-diphospho-sugar transferase domain-containing protein n=1 Tax=Rhizoclosmatium globosum TaxID=329046 RepID=A0A1Y2CBE2_9FUNG|nr:hypothetical protein BCR33DRAFT_717241 [Rhizoclosmatium globosum]|eukprot:ORY44164.1 hypothetical protein BCR33DRAFT_717241 [Rhizoclosmatium globosum]